MKHVSKTIATTSLQQQHAKKNTRLQHTQTVSQLFKNVIYNILGHLLGSSCNSVHTVPSINNGRCNRVGGVEEQENQVNYNRQFAFSSTNCTIPLYKF